MEKWYFGKNDFQFVLRSLSKIMFIVSHSMESDSMLFATNNKPYL